VVSEEDAYLYALYQQADGKIYQIFPNAGQKDNHVRPKHTSRFPAKAIALSGRLGRRSAKS